MLERAEDETHDILCVDPDATLDLRKGNNRTVDLTILVVGPGFVLDSILSLHLRIGTLGGRTLGKRQTGEDKDWLDAGLVELTKVTLNAVGKRER